MQKLIESKLHELYAELNEKIEGLQFQFATMKIQEINRMTEDEDRPLNSQSPMIPPISIFTIYRR